MAFRKMTLALCATFLLIALFSGCNQEVPNPGPRIAINSPKEGTAFRKGGKLGFNIAVNDADGVSQVTVTTNLANKDNTLIGTLTVAGGGNETLLIDSSLVLDPSLYQAAGYFLTTVATDASGNSKKISVRVAVND